MDCEVERGSPDPYWSPYGRLADCPVPQSTSREKPRLTVVVRDFEEWDSRLGRMLEATATGTPVVVVADSRPPYPPVRVPERRVVWPNLSWATLHLIMHDYKKLTRTILNTSPANHTPTHSAFRQSLPRSSVRDVPSRLRSQCR
jgi:hypothetical protein